MTPKQFKTGQKITGPGTGTSDSIYAQVPAGSFVMPADSTEAYGDEALAALGSPIAFDPERARQFQSSPSPRAPQGGFDPEKFRQMQDVRVSNGETLFTPEQIYEAGVKALTGMLDQTHTPVAEMQGFHGEKREGGLMNGGLTDEEDEDAIENGDEMDEGGTPDDSADFGERIPFGTQDDGAEMRPFRMPTGPTLPTGPRGFSMPTLPTRPRLPPKFPAPRFSGGGHVPRMNGDWGGDVDDAAQRLRDFYDQQRVKPTAAPPNTVRPNFDAAAKARAADRAAFTAERAATSPLGASSAAPASAGNAANTSRLARAGSWVGNAAKTGLKRAGPVGAAVYGIGETVLEDQSGDGKTADKEREDVASGINKVFGTDFKAGNSITGDAFYNAVRLGKNVGNAALLNIPRWLASEGADAKADRVMGSNEPVPEWMKRKNPQPAAAPAENATPPVDPAAKYKETGKAFDLPVNTGYFGKNGWTKIDPTVPVNSHNGAEEIAAMQRANAINREASDLRAEREGGGKVMSIGEDTDLKERNRMVAAEAMAGRLFKDSRTRDALTANMMAQEQNAIQHDRQARNRMAFDADRAREFAKHKQAQLGLENKRFGFDSEMARKAHEQRQAALDPEIQSKNLKNAMQAKLYSENDLAKLDLIARRLYAEQGKAGVGHVQGTKPGYDGEGNPIPGTPDYLYSVFDGRRLQP